MSGFVDSSRFSGILTVYRTFCQVKHKQNISIRGSVGQQLAVRRPQKRSTAKLPDGRHFKSELVSGFVRIVSEPGEPVNRMTYVSDYYCPITETISNKAFTMAHRNMMVRQLVFPPLAREPLLSVKEQRVPLALLVCCCSELMYAKCVDVFLLL